MHPCCTLKANFARNINVFYLNTLQEAAGSNPVTRTKMLATKSGKIISVLPLFVAFFGIFYRHFMRFPRFLFSESLLKLF
nr:MAG TPA: hypothetical protein [Caudoviricetes sp.]